MNATTQTRRVTSAVSFLSVAIVRKILSNLRTSWRNQSWARPFNPGALVDDEHGITHLRFAFLFLLGHHRKRHEKSSRVERI